MQRAAINDLAIADEHLKAALKETGRPDVLIWNRFGSRAILLFFLNEVDY